MLPWKNIGEQWPYLKNLKDGTFAQVVIVDEPSRLFIASVLPNETMWRTSMLLDGVHREQSGFLTLEAAQHYAEHVLTDSIASIETDDVDFTGATFNEPFREVAALLTMSVLKDDEQIAHISEYKREWIAVCVSATALEDYAFQRDSDGRMAMRLRMERLEVR